MYEEDDKNEYLDYSYTKFNDNEQRSRTNSQHQLPPQSQFKPQPQYQNQLNSSSYRQPPAQPSFNPPPNMDMMQFMQQMQQMQQMMSQFPMFQMMQQQGQEQGQSYLPQAAPITLNKSRGVESSGNVNRNGPTVSKIPQEPYQNHRRVDNYQSQQRQQREGYSSSNPAEVDERANKEPIRREFRQERENHLKQSFPPSSTLSNQNPNPDRFVHDYLPTEKSQLQNSGRKRELDSYLYEERRVEPNAFNNKKGERKYQEEDRGEKPTPMISLKKTPVSFDDMPIRPKAFDPIPTPPSSSSAKFNFDEMPIKTTSSYATYEPQPRQVNRNSKKNKFQQLEDKPIKGLGKDYNDVFDENQQDPYQRQDTSVMNNESSRPKNFLKKGTRQFLSSARSKMKPEKRDEDYQEKSRIQPVHKSKKIETAKAPAKNKNLSATSTTKFKIETEDNDELMFRNETQAPKRNKSPRPPAKPSTPASKPQPSKSPYATSSVQQIIDEDRVQLIHGVIVSLSQFDQIKEKYMMQDDTLRDQLQKVKKLKSKYEEMTKILQRQRSNLMQQLNRQKQVFEEYKQEQLKKINNQKRVAERQKNAVCNQSYKKEKEELEREKKEWDKERQEIKKKEASSKHYIEKLKKEIEELKKQSSAGFGTGIGMGGRESYEMSQSGSVASNRRTMGNFERESSREKREEKVKPKFTYNINKEKEREKEKEKEREKEKEKEKEKFRQRERELDQSSDRSMHKKKTLGDKSKPQGKSTSFLTGTTSKPRKDQSSFSNHQQFDYDDIKFSNKNPKTQSKELSKNNQKPSFSSNIKPKPLYQPSKQPESEQSLQDEREPSQNDESDYQPYYQGMTIEDLPSLKLNIKMVTDQMIDTLFYYNKNKYYTQYLNQKKKPRVIREIEDDDPDKVITVYTDGTREIMFETGVKKEIFENGYSIIHFKNKDVKQKLPDGTVLYYFKEKNVEQMTFGNGMNIFRFENNQIEFHHPDGLIEIRHEDGSIKIQ